MNFINIDSLKKAVQEKETANHFLSLITDLSPGISYVFDLITQRHVYIAKSIETVLGYSGEHLTNMDADDYSLMFPSGSRKRIRSHVKAMASASDTEMKFLEFKMKCANGKDVWMRTIEKVFERNEKGEVIKTIGYALDNTKQMKMIEREKENTHFISEVTMLSPDTVYVYDLLKRTTIYSNRKLKKQIENSDTKKANPHPFMDLINPNDLEAYKMHLKKLKSQKTDKSLYLELRLKDETENYRWVAVTEKAFDRLENGKTSQIIGSIKDIQAFRQVQMEKEKLDKLQLALKNSNEKLERFAYISSHDLKEPLNTIISALDLMKLEMKSSKSVDLIQPIEDSTRRMKNLVEDLLNYSLLNKQPLNLKAVDLNELLLEVRQDMNATITQQNVILIVEELPNIKADRVLIKQVFQNLISNAIRYNDKEPLIRVSAQKLEKETIISIKDNGIGINEKDFDIIFDVFKRLHNKEQYFGTGIGLANCKNIIQTHKGKIWVESTISKGSTFYFSIPKAK